jgi:hypothetical protein
VLLVWGVLLKLLLAEPPLTSLLALLLLLRGGPTEVVLVGMAWGMLVRAISMEGLGKGRST